MKVEHRLQGLQIRPKYVECCLLPLGKVWHLRWNEVGVIAAPLSIVVRQYTRWQMDALQRRTKTPESVWVESPICQGQCVAAHLMGSGFRVASV
jgi:hypothetical protein